MAHWPGKVQFDDGTILLCEYSATVDACCPKLFSNEEELIKNWRMQDGNDSEPECDHYEEDVLIITPFDSWKAKACRKCYRLVEQLSLPCT